MRREWGAVTFVLTVIVGMIVVPLALYFANTGPKAVAVPNVPGHRQPDLVREPHAFAQRDAFQDPIAVSGQDQGGRGPPAKLSRLRAEPDSVAGHEPDSVADSVPLAGQLPEQAVAVWFDDVRDWHRHLPVGRAVGAHAHLDDVG